MTSDNSTRDTVSAKCAFGISNCNGLAETAASSENTIIEQVATLAQRYAARVPTAAEFKALKPELILETPDWDKPINIRRENLARPLRMPLSQNPWVALQAHVEGGVRPATKARSRAKRFIPIVLTLAFSMYFLGPVYLDEAYAPFLPDNTYRMVGRDRPIVLTNANGGPTTSSGNARVVFRLGCEAAWNVIPIEQRCANDALWNQREELFGSDRSFDRQTTFSTSPEQYLTSWARNRVSQDEAALQIPSSNVRQTDREVTPAASSPSNYDQPSLGTVPSSPASEHSTVEQEHKTSPKLRVENLPSRANFIPLPQARPKTI